MVKPDLKLLLKFVDFLSEKGVLVEWMKATMANYLEIDAAPLGVFENPPEDWISGAFIWKDADFDNPAAAYNKWEALNREWFEILEQ